MWRGLASLVEVPKLPIFKLSLYDDFIRPELPPTLPILHTHPSEIERKPLIYLLTMGKLAST